MTSFKGFSEEDIKKLSNQQTNIKPLKPIDESIVSNKRVLLKINKGQKNAIIKSLGESKRLHEYLDSVKTDPIPEEAKLSKPTPTEDTYKKSQAPIHKVESTSESKLNNLTSVGERIEETKVDPEEPLSNNLDKNKTEDKVKVHVTVLKEINEETLSQNEHKRDLEELQTRQKLMEEQNRKRKELLAKALADRTKRTREEAERLKEIEKELKRLDAMLSEDVSILRKQIELASLDYMEAQKKYYRVEKEFLGAKLNLHQKLERKELLTEHLCTIIAKNEERKAKKLKELLEKLNINAEESQQSSEKQSVTKETSSNGNGTK